MKLLRTKFGNINYDFPALPSYQAKVLSNFIQERMVDEGGQLKQLKPQEDLQTLQKEVEEWKPSPNRAREKTILINIYSIATPVEH